MFKQQRMLWPAVAVAGVAALSVLVIAAGPGRSETPAAIERQDGSAVRAGMPALPSENVSALAAINGRAYVTPLPVAVSPDGSGAHSAVPVAPAAPTAMAVGSGAPAAPVSAAAPARSPAPGPAAARPSGTPPAVASRGVAPSGRTLKQVNGPALVVNRGTATRRSVALTFDAGADRGYAELILDVLRDYGVRASFGMTGVWAEKNPDLVWRMANEGHRFINHSYDHDSFTGFSTNRRAQSREQRFAQLDRTEETIQRITGATTLPFFRSPFGDTDASVLRDIGERGYWYNVLWTVDSRGWMRYSAGAIIQRCLAEAQPGAIYVMHVGIESQDGPALASIITGLSDRGYSFETIDEILSE